MLKCLYFKQTNKVQYVNINLKQKGKTANLVFPFHSSAKVANIWSLHKEKCYMVWWSAHNIDFFLSPCLYHTCIYIHYSQYWPWFIHQSLYCLKLVTSDFIKQVKIYIIKFILTNQVHFNFCNGLIITFFRW